MGRVVHLFAVRPLVMVAFMVSALVGGSGPNRALADPSSPFNVTVNLALLNQLPELVLDPLTDPPNKFKSVKPREFDPSKTSLVQAAWLHGTGCPTNAKVEQFVPPAFTTTEIVSYTDPSCPFGDANDYQNEGLLLVKTGPTNNNAAAVAELTNVKGMPITELGYDIRKPGLNNLDPRGSHCGAGAPRFDLVSSTGEVFFIGCASPPPDMDSPGTMGWQRLRWGGAAPLLAFSATNPLCQPCSVTGMTFTRIVIVFDEGQDAGPDNFGAAFLDNVDVNGALVGRGGTNAG